jgi:hypothetical protein
MIGNSIKSEMERSVESFDSADDVEDYSESSEKLP